MNTGALWPTPAEAKAKVLRMQTKLQRWAGEDHERQFDDLYNLVHDPAFLVAGWQLVKHNKGARSAGVDGIRVSDIERRGVEKFLGDLQEELRRREYRPQPVRGRMIPKANGKLRRLGIPTVRDRVVQATLKMVLEPIFEEDFQPFSYGFRPGRRAHDAIAEIVHFGNLTYEWVLEGDIEACFDNIDHRALLDRVRRRVGDGNIVGLVKAFLKAGILSELGHASETPTGTPQGGILSPLLANIALSKLDDFFAQDWQESMADRHARQGRRRRGEGNWRLVRYADDWVVLISGTRDHAVFLRQRVEEVLAALGLRLSESKTKVTHLDEGIDFLGFHIQRKTKRGTEKRYTYTHPSAKALKGARQRVRERTRRGTGEPAEVVRRVNGQLRGFCNYFRFAVSKRAFGSLEWHSQGRVSHWLRTLHKRMTWRDFKQRFMRNGTLTVDGVRLYRPGTVPVRRYRYRGAQILNPWQRLAASASSPAP